MNGPSKNFRTGQEIRPVWLDMAVPPAEPAPSPSPEPTLARRSDRRAVHGLLAVSAIVLVAAVYLATRPGGREPGADEFLEAGWAAYTDGHYQDARQLLLRARSAGSTAGDLGELDSAIGVGPRLDTVAVLLDDGDRAGARELMRSVLSEAPDDRRALKAALQLEERPAVATAPTPPAVAVPPAPATAAPATAAAAVAPAPKAVAVRRARPTRRTAPAPREPPDRGVGAVLVRSDTPGHIVVDGKRTGRTTPATLQLSVGPHNLALASAANGRLLASRVVRVRSDRKASVSFVISTKEARRGRSATGARPRGARPRGANTVAPGTGGAARPRPPKGGLTSAATLGGGVAAANR